MATSGSSWLTTAFVDAAQGIGVSAATPALQAEAERLRGLWSTPERTYHNMSHLGRLLNALDELCSCVHNPDELRVATWYHGCVMFTPRPLDFQHCGEDLAAGTREARQHLERLGAPRAAIDRVCELIEFAHNGDVPADDVDAQVFYDTLLTPLRLVPQEYKTYRCAVRGEYGDMADRVYLLGRRRRVRNMLERDSLFLSPLAGDYEELARGNLTAELKRINQQLGEARPGADADLDPKEVPLTANGAHTGTVVIKKKSASPPRAAEAAQQDPTPLQGVPATQLGQAAAERAAAELAATNAGVSSLESVEDLLETLKPAAKPIRVNPDADGAGKPSTAGGKDGRDEDAAAGAQAPARTSSADNDEEQID